MFQMLIEEWLQIQIHGRTNEILITDYIVVNVHFIS